MDLPEVFDLTVQEKHITIGATKYVLREASESAASVFRTAALRGAKFSDNSISLGDLSSVQVALVSECLFELGTNGEELRKVPPGIIKNWPARIVRPMFDWVKEVSMLDETPKGKQDAENKTKN